MAEPMAEPTAEPAAKSLLLLLLPLCCLAVVWLGVVGRRRWCTKSPSLSPPGCTNDAEEGEFALSSEWLLALDRSFESGSAVPPAEYAAAAAADDDDDALMGPLRKMCPLLLVVVVVVVVAAAAAALKSSPGVAANCCTPRRLSLPTPLPMPLLPPVMGLDAWL